VGRAKACGSIVTSTQSHRYPAQRVEGAWQAATSNRYRIALVSASDRRRRRHHATALLPL